MEFKFTFFLIIGVLFGNAIGAQNGTLDTSFGGDGIVLVNNGGHDNAGAVVALPDNSLLIGMTSSNGTSIDAAVTRLNEDGTVDEVFGDNGTFFYDGNNGFDVVYDLEVINGGSIYACGGSELGGGQGDFLLFKLKSDGTLDNSFGIGGVVSLPVDTALDYCRAIEIDNLGRLVAAGTSENGVTGVRRNVVCRFLIDGSLDTTFADGGILLWELDGPSDVEDVVLNSQNEIFCVGRGGVDIWNQLPQIHKITEDGVLDATFGVDGTVNQLGQGVFEGAMLSPDEQTIYVVGDEYMGDGGDLIVRAYDMTGSVVSEFADNGLLQVDQWNNEKGFALHMLPNGNVVACGLSGFSGFTVDYFTVAFTLTGELDNSWGGNGKIVTTIGSSFDEAYDVDVDANGRVIIAGLSGMQTDGLNDAGVVRYLMNSQLSSNTSDVSCNGGNDGTITIIPTTGQAPYEYSINGVDYQTDSIFTALQAGEYIIYAQDAMEDIFQATVTIDQPFPISTSYQITADELVFFAIGGTSPYTYSLNGSDFQELAVFYEWQEGANTIDIMDANGCEFSSIINIASTIDISISNVSCPGGEDGVIVATPLFGDAPYQYSLDGEVYQSDSVFSGLTSGMYAIYVMDNNEVVNETSTFIDGPDEFEVTHEINGDMLTLIVSGGTPEYQYGLNGGDLQESADFEVWEAGENEVLIVDANGCEFETAIVISTSIQESAAHHITVFPNPVQNVLQLNATIQIQAWTIVDTQGRIALESYAWIQGQNIDCSALNAGVYFMSIKTNEGIEMIRFIKR